MPIIRINYAKLFGLRFVGLVLIAAAVSALVPVLVPVVCSGLGTWHALSCAEVEA